MGTTEKTRKLLSAIRLAKEEWVFLRPGGWSELEGAFFDHATYVLPTYVRVAEAAGRLLEAIDIHGIGSFGDPQDDVREALADLDALEADDG